VAKQDAKQEQQAGWATNTGQMFPGGFGLDPSQTGYPNMNMAWANTGGFNPMMQMQAGNWNGYPNMMGMSLLWRFLLLFA
jgi:hypothetical protein